MLERGFMVKRVRPGQLAWMRRPELDHVCADGSITVEVWEQPDGALYAHDPRQGPLVLERFEISRSLKEKGT